MAFILYMYRLMNQVLRQKGDLVFVPNRLWKLLEALLENIVLDLVVSMCVVLRQVTTLNVLMTT